MLLSSLLAAPLLAAASPNTGPSFSCSRASTPTEKVICSDPELAAWDRAHAQVYRQLDHGWDMTLPQQREWLAMRDKCVANKPCLLATYRDWPGFRHVMGGVGTAYERIGTGRRDPASINILPIHGQWYFFSLTALHQQTSDPGSTNTGLISGLVELDRGTATYSEGPEDHDCRFHLRKTPRGWEIEEFGTSSQCGGLNVFVSGTYVSMKRGRR